MRSILFAATMLAGCLAFAPVSSRAQEAVTAAIPAEAGPLPRGKLGDTIAPSAYRLELTIDPAQERFSGHAEIDATLKAPARHVWIHGRDLRMTRAMASVGGQSHAASYAELDPTGVALLTFAEPLPAGPLTLAFDYDAPFTDSASGLYRVKVGDQWYAWTQLQSIDARAVFPSFDEPGFKTPFEVTLVTPAGLKAVANAPEASSVEKGKLTAHRFVPTLPLPTYLVAMVVGPFAVLEGAVPPTPQRAHPLPLRMIASQPNADKLAYGLQGSKEIVALLEAYFADGFPYPKLDQIASPIMPGAMENAGADIYADSLIVLDEKSPPSQKRDFGMVVAHELAHQWFGDLVTPAWWDDIWLNESFANWMGYRIGGEWQPDLGIGAGALAEGFSAMKTDALTVGRPIHQPITDNAAIDSAFDSITYGKGGHVVAMIAGFMGDDKFRNGVRRYMAAHRYGNATSEDFFRALGEAAGDARIAPAMLGFVDQQGVPLLRFARAGKTGWTVTQSRYAQVGVTAPATTWQVPFCVRRDEARTCALLDGATTTLELAGPKSGRAALIPNAGGTGYYRFDLPAKDWDKLIASADRLPAGEALALSDSLFASFAAGRASPSQLIAAARKLADNPDRYASGAALDAINYLLGNGFLDKPASAAVARFIAREYGKRLAATGFDPRAGRYAGEDPTAQSARRLLVELLATQAKDPALNAKLAAAARAYLAGDTAALDPAYMGRAFAALVIAGKAEAAQAIGAAALASQDPVFRPAALGALGASGDAAVADWLLNQWKDERLRTLERLGLVRAVIDNPATRDFAYDWLKAHYPELAAGGGLFMATRVPGLLGGFCSAEAAERIAADFAPIVAQGGGRGLLTMQRNIEKTRNCGLLKAARSAEASKAFAKLK